MQLTAAEHRVEDLEATLEHQRLRGIDTADRDDVAKEAEAARDDTADVHAVKASLEALQQELHEKSVEIVCLVLLG